MWSRGLFRRLDELQAVQAEVDEVLLVERDQWLPVPDAAGRHPHVVLRAWPSPALGGGGEDTPGAGDLRVVRDDRTPFEPVVESAPGGGTPATDLGPLGQFPDGDEGEPDLLPEDGLGDPGGSAPLLDGGRHVGVDDDARHEASGESGFSRGAEVGEESVEFLVGFPDVEGELVE